MKMETKVRIMQTQAKECLEPPEAGRGKGRERCRHRRKASVKMETKVRIMQTQAKECLEPPEAGRGKGRPSPRAFRETVTLLTSAH